MESVRVSPACPFRYLDNLLSVVNTKVLDSKARANVVPDIADDAGVSKADRALLIAEEGAGDCAFWLLGTDIGFGGELLYGWFE